MKILLISSQVFPVPPPAYGGLEMLVYDLAEELGKLGHRVYVLCPDGSTGQHFETITPCQPSMANPEHLAYEAIQPALGDFDVIHDHSWAGHVYLAKREKPRLPLLHTCHSVAPYGSNPVEQPCWVCPSEWHAQHTRQLLGAEVRVVYHGVDLDRHRYAPEVSKEDFLLYMARVTDFKGAVEFVDLCRRTGMKGVLCGEDWYVEDVAYVRRVMEACIDTRGRVEYLGRTEQEQKVELMQKARCLVTPLKPPYYEIFGMATVEAMACGTPVLSTDRGAARELIVHGETGAVAADVSCLETGLQVALECSPEACRRQAEKFGRERMAREYVALYQQVAEGQGW